MITNIVSDTTISTDETYVEEGCKSSDVNTRRDLAKKVLTTLGLQLFVTVLILGFLIFYEPVRNGILSIYSTYRICLIVALIAAQLVVIIILACFRKLRRHSPTKYIIFVFFAIVMALWIGCTDEFAKSGIFGLGVFAISSFSLLIFNVLKKHDFEIFSQVIFAVVMCTIFFVILVLTKLLSIDVAGYASLVFLCFYGLLILHIWLIVREKHLFSISPEEYIFASLVVYVDIIIIWIILWKHRSTLFGCGK